MRLKALLLALPLLTGCMWGTPVSKFPAAQSPAGATVSYVLTGSTQARTGELFAVDDQYIYVFKGTLYRVAWARIRRIGAEKSNNEFMLYTPSDRSPAERARYAPISRFPQGLNGELLAEVLRRLDQPRLEEPQ